MRVKKMTHSVGCAATLLQENRVTGYSAKGKQRNDPVGNVLLRRVRKFEFM